MPDVEDGAIVTEAVIIEKDEVGALEEIVRDDPEFDGLDSAGHKLAEGDTVSVRAKIIKIDGNDVLIEITDDDNYRGNRVTLNGQQATHSLTKVSGAPE